MSTTETRAGLTLKPLEGASFGVEILGLVPREITDPQRDAIWDLYRERHGLLCFTFGRLLERDELHTLTSVFGENDAFWRLSDEVLQANASLFVAVD